MCTVACRSAYVLRSPLQLAGRKGGATTGSQGYVAGDASMGINRIKVPS